MADEAGALVEKCRRGGQNRPALQSERGQDDHHDPQQRPGSQRPCEPAFHLQIVLGQPRRDPAADQKRATRRDRDASHQKLEAMVRQPSDSRLQSREHPGTEAEPESGADLPVQKRGLGSRTAASLVTRAVARA
jgi:hypothetical protein